MRLQGFQLLEGRTFEQAEQELIDEFKKEGMIAWLVCLKGDRVEYLACDH